jgi:D-apionolactonase
VTETIRAGDLSFAVDGADLVDVRWGALDIASRVQVTVRDPSWGTMQPTVRSASVASVSDGVGVAIEAEHASGAFAWRATVEAYDRGELSFTFDGGAERSFEYRRIGVCVLHPWRSYAGAAYEATAPHGSSQGVLPMRIAPQARVDGVFRPMIEAFSHLRVAFPGRQVLDVDLQGELFELEDQRNWTDASFKTYPTPLARSEPRRMSPGERVRQRVVLRITGEALPAAAPAAPDVRVSGRTGATIPPIGMSVTSEPIEGAHHVRVPIVAAHPDLGALSRVPMPVELALAVDADASGVDAIAEVVRGADLARVLVTRTDEETTQPELVEEVRARLGVNGVPFVGGTSSFFSELNRNPPERDAFDGVAFSISPEVHAVDERSVRETLEIQPQVMAQARELVGDVPIHVSPVTLSADHPEAFRAVWTIGSLAALINAGAASVTIDASSRAAAVIARRHGLPVLDTDNSDARSIAALGYEEQGVPRVIVANLLGQRTPFELNGKEQQPLDAYEVRPSDASTASS